MVEIHTTRSTLLSSYGYDEAKQELYITFLKGGQYKYFDVHKDVYEAMINAESIGKFFLANIKNAYSFEKE